MKQTDPQLKRKNVSLSDPAVEWTCVWRTAAIQSPGSGRSGCTPGQVFGRDSQAQVPRPPYRFDS
jgi:hypothetical protein